MSSGVPCATAAVRVSPPSLLSSPLRERQTRGSRRDLVTLLPVMSRVRSTFLLAPVAPPALLLREIYTYVPVPYLLLSFSRSRLVLSAPPPFLFSLSLSLFSITLPVFDVRNVYHPVQASCSPPLLDLATQIGEVSTLLHEITSLPLDLPEKICQFDRPVIFAPAHALATFPLLFAVFFPLLSVII